MAFQYYKEKLSIIQKHTYQTLLQGLDTMNEAIKVLDTNLDSINKILDCIKNDHPELFYCATVELQTSGLSTIVYPQYEKTKEDIEQINNILIQNRRTIIGKLQGSDEWNKLCFLHDLFCTQIQYSNCGDIAHSIVGPIIHKIAVCEGISKAFKYVCDELSIECVVVNGTAKSDIDGTIFENHSWNKVRVNNEWVNIDVTFDLTISSPACIRHDYFCVSDGSIAQTHRADGARDLCCITEYLDYYATKGLIMYNQQTMVDYIKKSYKSGLRTYEVKLLSSSNIQNVQEKVVSNVYKALTELGVSARFTISLNKERLVVYINI